MASAMKTSEVITLSECESSEEEEKDLRGAASQPNALTDAVHSAMASAARVISPPLHESARAAASQTPSSGGQQDKKKKGKAARGKGRGRAKKSVAEDSCDDDADFEFEPRRENPARSGRGRGSVRRAASTTKTSKNSVEEYGADEGDNAEDDDDGDEKAVVVKGRKRRLKQSAASSDEEVGLASESDGRQRSAKSSTSRRTSTSSARRTPRATDAEADTPSRPSRTRRLNPTLTALVAHNRSGQKGAPPVPREMQSDEASLVSTGDNEAEAALPLFSDFIVSTPPKPSPRQARGTPLPGMRRSSTATASPAQDVSSAAGSTVEQSQFAATAETKRAEENSAETRDEHADGSDTDAVNVSAEDDDAANNVAGNVADSNTDKNASYEDEELPAVLSGRSKSRPTAHPKRVSTEPYVIEEDEESPVSAALPAKKPARDNAHLPVAKRRLNGSNAASMMAMEWEADEGSGGEPHTPTDAATLATTIFDSESAATSATTPASASASVSVTAKRTASAAAASAGSAVAGSSAWSSAADYITRRSVVPKVSQPEPLTYIRIAADHDRIFFVLPHELGWAELRKESGDMYKASGTVLAKKDRPQGITIAVRVRSDTEGRVKLDKTLDIGDNDSSDEEDDLFAPDVGVEPLSPRLQLAMDFTDDVAMWIPPGDDLHTSHTDGDAEVARAILESLPRVDESAFEYYFLYCLSGALDPDFFIMMQRDKDEQWFQAHGGSKLSLVVKWLQIARESFGHPRLKTRLRALLAKYPKMQFEESVHLEQCYVCKRPDKLKIRVTLSGQPYDRRMHSVVKNPGPAPEPFDVNGTCLKRIRTYHGLCHFTQHLVEDLRVTYDGVKTLDEIQDVVDQLRTSQRTKLDAYFAHFKSLTNLAGAA